MTQLASRRIPNSSCRKQKKWEDQQQLLYHKTKNKQDR